MRVNTHISHIFILTFLLALVTCSTSEAPKTSESPKKPALPKVTDSSNHLLFSWFEENEAQTATNIADIPDNVKKEVRVQDLKVPPEKRDPRWLFLVDLTKKNKNGRYSVSAVERAKYEMKRHPPIPKIEKGTSDSKTAASVVMYATPYCPHCKTARRWLLEQKIPYKEIDVNKDTAAAAALAQKGQAQGVPTSGVPMFEINGRLIPGFDPAAIKKALAAPPLKAPNINKLNNPGMPQKPLPIPAPVKPQPTVPAGNSPSTITI